MKARLVGAGREMRARVSHGAHSVCKSGYKVNGQDEYFEDTKLTEVQRIDRESGDVTRSRLSLRILEEIYLNKQNDIRIASNQYLNGKSTAIIHSDKPNHSKNKMVIRPVGSLRLSSSTMLHPFLRRPKGNDY